MPRHLALLIAAAALAACCTAASPPEPAAAAFAPRCALRADQQGGCGDCKPDYSLTISSKGGCTIPICLWYTDRRYPDGQHGCWDARPDATTLIHDGEVLSLDTSRTVFYETGGKEANDGSPKVRVLQAKLAFVYACW